MVSQTSQQLLHDRVNLARLVRRLEKSVVSDKWDSTNSATWIKAQGTMQKVKFARKLLKRVELYDDRSSSSRIDFGDIRDALDRLEAILVEHSKRVAPKRTRPELILPTIAVPEKTPVPSSIASHPENIDHPLIPSEANVSTSVSPEDLLLSPSDTSPISLREDSFLSPAASPARPAVSPLPSGSNTGVSAGAGAPAFLQNSAALQEELSAQLAQMATQLKNNTLHFATSLERDKSILTEAQEKLERNFDVMTKERTRLRDHRSKSWGTTWITLLSIIVAVVGFMLTFFVIRLTR